MTISLIACIDKSRAIGNKGSLLTKPPLDFKHFKSKTEGRFCVFGRTTFKEIGKPLSNRHNIVLSSNPNIELPSGVHHYMSANDVLWEYDNYAERKIDLFICGGSKVYQDFLAVADYIYLTIVDHTFSNSDRFFPEFSLEDWEIAESIKNNADENYPYDYHFITYKRRFK